MCRSYRWRYFWPLSRYSHRIVTLNGGWYISLKFFFTPYSLFKNETVKKNVLFVRYICCTFLKREKPRTIFIAKLLLVEIDHYCLLMAIHQWWSRKYISLHVYENRTHLLSCLISILSDSYLIYHRPHHTSRLKNEEKANILPWKII